MPPGRGEGKEGVRWKSIFALFHLNDPWKGLHRREEMDSNHFRQYFWNVTVQLLPSKLSLNQIEILLTSSDCDLKYSLNAYRFHILAIKLYSLVSEISPQKYIDFFEKWFSLPSKAIMTLNLSLRYKLLNMARWDDFSF